MSPEQYADMPERGEVGGISRRRGCDNRVLINFFDVDRITWENSTLRATA